MNGSAIYLLIEQRILLEKARKMDKICEQTYDRNNKINN